MSSVSERARRWTELVLVDPRVVPAGFVLYVLVGLLLLLTDRTLNNEGLLTHHWASWASQDFVAVFFFQKVKPVLAAVYAPVAHFGMTVTLVAHIIVAATAIPLLASTARALGHRLPNASAVVLAFSPLFVLAGPAGLSNADGVVGIALALQLLCARRAPFLAGLVTGLLPWVRFELVLFAAAMAVHALATREHRRLLLGIAVFPLAYVCAGAVYHADVLWIAHYPPAVSWDPDNPIYEGQRIGLRYVLEPALALTPAAALAVALRFGTLARVERALVAYAAVIVVVMGVFPIFKLANFGTAPRYLLPLLPVLALLAGRALSSIWERVTAPPAVLVAAFAVGLWIATRQDALAAVLVPLVMLGIVLELAHRGRAAGAVGMALVLVLVGPFLPIRTEVTREAIAAYLAPMTEWLRDHPEARGDRIYTNANLLAAYLEGRSPSASVTYIAGVDTRREIIELTNPRNGQRERVLRLCATDLYGQTIFDPAEVPDGALLAFRVDSRLPLLFPPETWDPRLDVLADTPRFRIARLRPRLSPRAILAAAIEAHGGGAALSHFDDLRIGSFAVFRDMGRFERVIDYRAPSSFAMTLSQEGREVLAFGSAGDRCWRRDNAVELPCDEDAQSDHRRILAVLEARFLHRIDPARVADAGSVDVDGVQAPAIRVGDMRLAFDPDTRLLLRIEYEEAGVPWVETFSDYVERAGAKVAAHRELTIGGEPDVTESWAEIVPGGADASRLVPPDQR